MLLEQRYLKLEKETEKIYKKATEDLPKNAPKDTLPMPV